MKLLFFLIAFFAIFLRVYLGYTHLWNSGDEGSMTIKGDGLYEQMKWSGKVELSEDETTIKSISPGGYLKYRHNDKKMIAESNSQNGISYEIFDGDNKLSLDSVGKKFIADAIQELISWGFDAEGRVDRIYKKGGDSALLVEMARIKLDNIKDAYLDRLLKNNALTTNELSQVIRQIDSMASDMDKARFLTRFGPKQLSDSLITESWLLTVARMNSDMDKANLLRHFLDQDTLSGQSLGKVLDITDHFGSDMDKSNLISHLIDRNQLPSSQFSEVLDVIKHFGSDMDKSNLIAKMLDKEMIPPNDIYNALSIIKDFGSDMDKSNLISKLLEKEAIPVSDQGHVMAIVKDMGSDLDKENIYKKMMEKFIKTEDQWIRLINETTGISSDFDRSNLLVEIASKMPRTEAVKAAYQHAAKRINGDMDYGRVMKAVQ
jgi:hypothetical protein